MYIAYIDYVKAYDKLDRNVLLQKLAGQGCGRKYLGAIWNSLKNTKNTLGGELFTSSAGIRQGATNSCSLFTFYINSTSDTIRGFEKDGHIENFHSLLFMDDTAVLATSQDDIQQKLILLYGEVKSISVEVHPHKSKYMAINGKDHCSIELNYITIDHTDE